MCDELFTSEREQIQAMLGKDVITAQEIAWIEKLIKKLSDGGFCKRHQTDAVFAFLGDGK